MKLYPMSSIQCSPWVARRPPWSSPLKARQSLRASRWMGSGPAKIGEVKTVKPCETNKCRNVSTDLAMADVPMYQTMAGIFFGSEPTSFCGVAVFDLYRLYPCLNHPSGVLSFLTCINIAWESVHKAVLNHQKMASNPPEIVKIQGHHFFNAKWLQQKKQLKKKNSKKKQLKNS